MSKKSLLRVFATLFLFAFTLSVLVACGGMVPLDVDKIAIKIADGKAEVILLDANGKTEEIYKGEISGDNLAEFLRSLNAKGVLEVKSSTSGYGEYFTSVGTLSQDDDNGVYLYFYTNLDDYKDFTDYALTVDYDGTTLTSAFYSASDLPLSDGAIYLIGLISFT